MKIPWFFERLWRESIATRIERGPEVLRCDGCGWTPRWAGFRTGRYVVRRDGKRIVYTKREDCCETIKGVTGLEWKEADKGGNGDLALVIHGFCSWSRMSASVAKSVSG